MLAPRLAPVRRIGAGLFPRRPRQAPTRCPRKPATSPGCPLRAIGTKALHGAFPILPPAASPAAGASRSSQNHSPFPGAVRLRRTALQHEQNAGQGFPVVQGLASRIAEPPGFGSGQQSATGGYISHSSSLTKGFAMGHPLPLPQIRRQPTATVRSYREISRLIMDQQPILLGVLNDYRPTPVHGST